MKYTWMAWLIAWSSSNLFSQSASVLGIYTLAPDSLVYGKRFGGISGIDFDEKEKVYYLISDDRSYVDKARFYKAKIKVGTQGISSIHVDTPIFLKSPNGTFYAKNSIDGEAIRLTKDHQLLVGDEGGHEGTAGIVRYDLRGNFLRRLPIDSGFIRQIRDNNAFEAVSLYSKNSLLYSTETSLKSDGALSDTAHTSLLRLIAQEIPSGKWLWQASYRLGKILPENYSYVGMSDIGLSEILVLNSTHFLALERTGVPQEGKKYRFDCRLYEVEFLKNKTPQDGFRYTTKKRELLRFADYPNGKENFEGMCFGPSINGKPSLLVVSDNNFSKVPTVFFLLQLDEISRQNF